MYWGGPDGFDEERRTSLPTHGAHGISVADIDADGHLDVLFSSWQSLNGPVNDSFIYWGSDEGLDADRRTPLVTLGAMGNSIHDLDKDGWLDVAFANSTAGGNIFIDSWIYWGAEDGFAPGRRTTGR